MTKKKTAKKKTAKKKTAKKKTSREKKKKTVSAHADDPNWINPETFDPDDFPELNEESYIFVNGTGKPNTPKGGRPAKKIRLLPVFEMSKFGCTESEIAAATGIFKDAMTRAKKNNPILGMLIEAGRDHGCMSLRRQQHVLAMAGSERLLIWLGTNRLKQSTTPEPDPELENPEPLQISYSVKPAKEAVQVTNAKSTA